MKRLVTIVGPTGVGKSALALILANDFDCEIVSADSRQIYRLMDIGTAKPTACEQAQVRHHLLDIVAPNQDFSLSEYQQKAYQAIESVMALGKLPLLVGGSGLYVWAVLEGWQIPKVPPNPALRRELEERAQKGETSLLYQELWRLNAEAAARIDPRNVRRVIRALEISYETGVVQLPAKNPPFYTNLIIGLTCERQLLYERVDRRVDKMVQDGLLDEVKDILRQGFQPELPALTGIGYRQVVAYLQGKNSWEDTFQQIKNDSHRLVRRQYNWFSLKNDKIHWFDVETDYYNDAKALVSKFLVE